MRAVLQRVLQASVDIKGYDTVIIKKGILVFLGITHTDTLEDIKYIVQKIINLRIFEDEDGKMNQSISDMNYEILLISQFTLYGDARKGRRPNFSEAAPSDISKLLYNDFINYLKIINISFKTGIFGADMKVSLINDGPVTILLDSKKEF